MITAEWVRERVAEIRAMADDDEVAHSEEDSLRQAVLAAIAEGAPNAAELASEALKTSQIRFARWCA